MNDTVVLGGDISLQQSLCADGELVLLKHEVAYPVYSGAVMVTPSDEEQTLQTENKTVLENITINPIPSNYGLITWNGAVLTVS